MSLSRILNDDSVPVRSSRSAYATSSRSALPPQPPLSPTLTSGRASPPHSHHSHNQYARLDSAARAYPRSPASYDAPVNRDAYVGPSRDWLHDIPLSSGSNARYSTQQEYTRVATSESVRGIHHLEDDDQLSRKRRKGDQDTDSGQRRTGQRKSSRRTKQQRPLSPSNGNLDPELSNDPIRKSEEERRLASSDLDDSEEVWIGELSDYVLETKKRQNQVAKWFQASILERNSVAAQHISHRYATRIANIPTSPPTPPHIHISQRLDVESGILSPGMHVNDDYHTQRLTHRESRQGNVSAEDAAQEFERSILGESPAVGQPFVKSKAKGKGKESNKRRAPSVVSGGSSDLEVPQKDAIEVPAHKKRKLEKDAASVADDIERSVVDEPITDPKSTLSTSKLKGKGKQLQREPSHDSVSLTPKPPRKKPGPKKKLGLPVEVENEVAAASHPPSVTGDATPSASRPTSPAPTNSSVVYELDEIVPPLKRAKKVDDNAMIKRIKTLEESQRKVWTNIARRDVAKVYKYHTLGYQTKQSLLERMAKLASIQARKPFTKTVKANKDTQAKAKRLMREMQVFWKKNEKEERDVRKREQKEATDRLKIEEEKREAARQARKLEFLISQTELYSHFVGSKLKTTEIEGDGQNLPVPVGVEVAELDAAALPDIDFDDADPTNLHRHARHNAQEAIALAKQRAQQFDNQAALERKTNEALKLAKAQAHVRDENEENPSGTSVDSDELNFQNPTSLSGPLTIGQPKMLMAQLKEYQLKGLNWLATLYEQGINGILADEMGLGKTVQSISLLAYLAETHDIWGPFLVVAPASTLHNWQQELTRFVPKLKALPYWGNVKDRATLRKFWSKKEISYNEDAPFHVLITSYQLVTQDQQYFQRVKWQYMILDEAQNIKNSSSVRWKTLLGFQCRNRLLLTGTPIQNSMQELWALLHFIMPSLFDSHDEFNEWFSKDIESAAENKGSKLNEHQLRRLHMILKPFMLRRVKRHVQNELSEKIEKDIYVDLSARQRALYQALLANVSVADLLEKAANIGDADSARSLMNLVMQFRKVCNHPELFERADVIAPLSFSVFGRTASLIREGDFVFLPYSTRNPIEVTIPALLYREGGLVDIPHENTVAASHSSCLTKMFNIWSTEWIHKSLYQDVSASFSFLRLLDMSPTDAHTIHNSPLIRRTLFASQQNIVSAERSIYPFDIPDLLAHLNGADGLPELCEISTSVWKESCISRPELKWFIPPTVAPPISLHCSDRTFIDTQAQIRDAPLESLALYGLPPHLRESEVICQRYKTILPGVPPTGLFSNSPANQLPISPMQVPEAKRLIYDSAKLARLDSLLQELKAGDHRVLVYFQMTRMMDLMEEYLIYRQYKYLRLDGSSKLEDRRDMVIDWQTRPDIFVFLLSTRAGGLGINLTAADTVVFYDHDWNPSNDAQAMDRAHRLGQTRQVTVYRLITRGTIDERIIQLARVKKDVQDIVVGNKNFTDVTKPSEIVQLLLNDEQLASLESSGTSKLSGKQPNNQGDKDVPPACDLWNEEGDDFFGHSSAAPVSSTINLDMGDDESKAPPQSTRGRKRKNGATGAPRGRKPGRKRGGAVGLP
ncbi:SNF2 family DNA-dependent ATPase [Crucibulum laeve]|uniref:Chromatin-remodeling ATPase INO80 n=1 Tax=Crucibulum laeve TaxID=68775 RepID=A0A5C3M6F6_9AGAR|nr:SNF2 family DNA-dependent ATPase [Crucibulum laeve]